MSAAASEGLFALTAALTGAFLVHGILGVRDDVLPSVLVSLYIGSGLALNALVSVLVGVFFISPLVPVAFSVLLSVLTVLLRRMRGRVIDLRALPSRLRSDLAGLIVLGLSFLYFVLLSGLMQWPPPGDVATAHGPMATLFLSNGRIPLTEQGYVILYPPGLQALAASIGPIILNYGGEMVFSLGAVLTALLAPLAYAITYTCTGRWRWAVVVAIVPLIPHPSGNAEQWTEGYFVNGPYPNLFGFVILLTLLAALMIAQRPNQAWSHVRKAVLGALVTLACLVVYPSFSITSTLLVGIWIVYQRKELLAELTALLRSRRARAVLVAGAVVLGVAVAGYLTLLEAVGQAPGVMVDYLLGKFLAGGGGAAAIPAPYAAIPWFFVDHVSGWVSLLAMAGLLLTIRRKTWDFFDTFYFILGVALFVSLTEPGFAVTWPILPSRISPLFVVLAWPVALRLVLTRRALPPSARPRASRRVERATRLMVNKNVAPMIVVALILLAPVAMRPSLAGDILNPVSSYGHFSAYPGYDEDFQVLQWIAEHANHSALMANDGSYLSRYLLSVTVQNMSNTVWDEAVYPQRAHDLAQIWKQPRNISYLSEMFRRYDVRYVFATSEPGTVFPKESLVYGSKVYPPALLDTVFDHYPFLAVDYAQGWNRVYDVRSVPTLATTAVIGNATSAGFWDLVGVSGAGSIGLPVVEPNGTVLLQPGAFASWELTHDLSSPQVWTSSSYLSVELWSSSSVGLTISVFDTLGRSNSWDIVTLSGQVTRVDLSLAFPDDGARVVDLGSVAGISVTNATVGSPPRPGDEITIGGVFLSG